MNVAFFLHPKSEIAYMYDDDTIRQGIEKLKMCGYAAVPVITKDGKYVGTVSEGDFLKKIYYGMSGLKNLPPDTSPQDFLDQAMGLSKTKLTEILKKDAYPPVSITATASDLMNRAMEQNFVPVVDDEGIFIGIVTRRDIIKFFLYSK